MCRDIHAKRHGDEIASEVKESGNSVLLAEEQSASPVDVEFWMPEVVDRNDNPHHDGLKFPSPRIVTPFPERPEQQGRRDHVEEAEQADGERDVRIKHVLRAADDVMASEQSSREVDAVESLKKKESAGRPGENERTFEPESDADQDVAEVTEEHEIRKAVLSVVKGGPHDQPCSPAELEPQGHRRFHRGHCMRKNDFHRPGISRDSHGSEGANNRGVRCLLPGAMYVGQ